jgi:hypothetical protein
VDDVIRDRALLCCRALHPVDPLQAEPCEACLRAMVKAEREAAARMDARSIGGA